MGCGIFDKGYQGDIYFHKKKIPARLSAYESVLKLFSEDKQIVLIYKGFSEIIIESDLSQNDHYSLMIPMLAKRYRTLEAIKDNIFNTSTKLALAHINAPAVFNEINDEYIHFCKEVKNQISNNSK